MMAVIRPTVNALEIAGSLCGVPYVGTAAIVLKDIVKCCDDVAIHKASISIFPRLLAG
jgi:hypothetical protein